MRRAIPAAVVAIALLGGAAAVTAATQTAGGDRPAPVESSDGAEVEVSTRLNRTAVWVGDPILWTVEITFPATVDIIADDLAPEKLSLVGLEVLGADTRRATTADGAVVHQVQYRLRSYEVAEAQLRVAPLTVRYYERQPGQRAEDVTAAGEVTVPAAVIAWRSAIPSDLDTVDLRPLRPMEAPPGFIAWTRPIGLALVVMSVAPVTFWAYGRVRNMRRPRERRPSLRMARKATHEALASLRSADTSDELERRAAYAQLSEVVRRYLSDTAGVPAHALTSEEITARFGGDGGRASVAALGDVMAECEQAQYGPSGQLPTTERFRDSVTLVERLV